MPQKVPQSEAPEAPFLIEAPFLVIINRRLAAVKICRKFHESNFENVSGFQRSESERWTNENRLN